MHAAVTSLADLWTHGATVAWEPLPSPTPVADLPGYPFEHRLVQEEHSRSPRERARERHTLAFTPRQLGRLGTRKMLDLQPPEQPVDTSAAEGHVLLDVQMRKEGVLLEHEPDGAFLGTAVDMTFGIEPDVVSAGDHASRRPREPRNRTQHGRLARP